MRLRPFWLTLGSTLSLTPVLAKAQNIGVLVNLPGCNIQTGQIAASCIPRYIAHIISLVFMLIGIFFLMNIMFAGYQIIFASLEGNDRSKGMNRLYYSILGFLVAAGSFIIMDTVLTTALGPAS
jgi:hypothetical protein